VDATGLDARFYSPYGIIGDLAGSLYVVDGTTLRRIALATGAVTTLAGTPSSTGPPGGPAPFTWPTGIVSDGSGNLYVSDSVAFWKVDTATGTVTTVQGAPSHSPEDAPPFGLAIDGTGTLYYPNFGSIQKLVIATGTVTTLAGGSGNGSVDGIGAAAQFSGPSGVASDGAGTLYVADGNTIRKIVTATGAVSTVIGSPDRIGVSLGALPASLGSPRGVFLLPTGELAIVDNAENAVLIAHF